MKKILTLMIAAAMALQHAKKKTRKKSLTVFRLEIKPMKLVHRAATGKHMTNILSMTCGLQTSSYGMTKAIGLKI